MVKRSFFGLLLMHTALLPGHSLHAQGFVDAAPMHDMTFQAPGDSYGSGASFYDFDQDGWDDITFTMPGESIKFYRNTGGSFVLEDYEISTPGQTRSVLWADYDNDGDADLVVTTYEGVCKLYRNNGNFEFTDQSITAGLLQVPQKTYGASWGDMNNDGYLDLYVCNYEFEGDPTDQNLWNQLYMNNGDGTFTNVTASSGAGDDIKLSFQGMWLDHDLDGLQDIFIINDRWFANSLYRNNGDGTFTNVAADTGVELTPDDPMSITFGDPDNDQDMDIFYTNTGNLDRYCRLLENNGTGNYSETAQSHGISVLAWTWGATWVDILNNSHLDLYITSALPGTVTAYPNYLLGNLGNGQFVNAFSLMQGENTARSFSPVCGDFDNNGFTDIAVQNQAPYRPYLWQNLGGSNHYIKITPHGTVSNKDAVGTWVKVHFGGQTRIKYTVCGENYLGQSSQHLIFGLGTHTVVDSVELVYLSGQRDVYYELDADSSYHFTEGETFMATVIPSTPQTLCNGSNVILDGGDHSSWNWSTGHTGRYLTVSAPGSYWVTVTNQHGIIAQSDPVVVHPAPSFTTEISHASGGQNNGVILISATGGLAPYSITVNGAPAGTLVEDLAPGTYSIAVTDANGCTVTSNVVISISVGSAALTAEDEAMIWPNPFDDMLQLGSIAELTILDTEGRTILSIADHQNTINTASIAPGAYIIRMTTMDGNIHHQRMIKL